MTDTVKMKCSSFGQDEDGNIVREDGEFDTGMTEDELNDWLEPLFDRTYSPPPGPYVDLPRGPGRPGDHNIFTLDGQWLYSCSEEAWEEIRKWIEYGEL